ncbi:hypothetical protein MMC08_003624 [Hypocenomyce scalaris]|nr:hypothetical protein [Hypocenomyce scalaris]
MLAPIFLVLAFPLFCLASTLYVSSYSGNVTSLSLTQSGNGTYDLRTLSTIPCASDPSWLTFDQERRLLYCIGEGLAGLKGAITVFEAATGGLLEAIGMTETLAGGVSSVLYQTQEEGMGSTSALTTYLIPPPYPPFPPFPPTLIQTLPFSLSRPGPISDRQSAPHPHQVVLDPTGRYVLSPDLGSDLVRVFRIGRKGLLVECESLRVEKGTGVRHLVFRVVPNGRRRNGNQQAMSGGGSERVFMYAVGELSNTVTAYAVTYSGVGLEFEEIDSIDTFGGKGVPLGAGAAEIAILGNHLLISNRNDSSFLATPTNSFPLPRTVGQSDHSDSISTFALSSDGMLHFSGLSPAGGLFPRQFSPNRAGNLVAVGLQLSGKVAIIARNVETGKMGEIEAEVEGLGEVTCVIWDAEE